MRSTRAVAAVERLKTRSQNADYAMIIAGGLFYLGLRAADGSTQKLCEPLGLDDFVKFVNAFGPQTPRKISKLDAAFEQQLARRKARGDA
jgi:hypothetical protein